MTAINAIIGKSGTENLVFQLDNKDVHGAIIGTQRNVLLRRTRTILSKVMSNTTPEKLNIVYLGNNRETRNEIKDRNFVTPIGRFNQTSYHEADIERKDTVRTIEQVVDEHQSRLNVFRKVNLSSLSKFNAKFTEKSAPEILVVVDYTTDNMANIDDEFRDLIDYVGKLGHNAGIHLLFVTDDINNDRYEIINNVSAYFLLPDVQDDLFKKTVILPQTEQVMSRFKNFGQQAIATNIRPDNKYSPDLFVGQFIK